MTLQDFANLGEAIGGIAVLITLIFLTFQIRQNTKSVLASTEHQLGQLSAQFNALIAANSDLARIYRIGLTGSEPLTPDESMRWLGLLGLLFHNFDSAYRRYERGQFDEETWRAWDKVLGLTLASSEVAGWWQNTDHVFSSSFCKFVDSKVEALHQEGAPTA